MHPELEKALTATPAEIDAHYDRVNAEGVAWAKLESQRRQAIKLANLITGELKQSGHHDADSFSILSGIAETASKFATELDRAKDGIPLTIKNAERLLDVVERAIDLRFRFTVLVPRLRTVGSRLPRDTQELTRWVLDRCVEHIHQTVETFIAEYEAQ